MISQKAEHKDMVHGNTSGYVTKCRGGSVGAKAHIWVFGQGVGKDRPRYIERMPGGTGPCVDTLVLGLWGQFRVRFPGGML